MMYIIEVAEGTDVFSLSEEIQAAVSSVGGQWPESIMPNTQVIDGRQVVLVYADASYEQVGTLIEMYDLDWVILASEGEPINQAELLPYFSDVNLYDEEGNIAGSEPVTDLTGKLQTFSGHNWTF